MKSETENVKWDFGLNFQYPGPKGRNIIIAKPKHIDVIEVASNTVFDKMHLDAFNKLDKLQQIEFIKNLNQIILNSNFEGIIKTNPNKIMFVIVEKLFIESGTISINDFYRAVKTVAFCSMRCVNFIQARFDKNYNPGKDEFDAADFEPYF